MGTTNIFCEMTPLTIYVVNVIKFYGGLGKFHGEKYHESPKKDEK